MTARYDRRAIGTIRVHAVNAAGVYLEYKKTGNGSARSGASAILGDGFRHGAPVQKSDANSVVA
jgi:hypothetical protein